MMREIEIMSIPELFRCPISLDLLSDPVTLCTGQTYDRSSIEKWISAGNFTCPVTMQKLHDLSLVPNHTLRHLIDQWLLKSNHHHHHYWKMGCSSSSSTSDDIMFSKNVLESKDSSLEKRMQVLEKVRILSQDLPWKNEGLLQMGFLPLILRLVFVKNNIITKEKSMGLVEKSLDCALKLMPFSCLSDLNMLIEESKFESFKLLLQQGSNVVKIGLCNIIEMVCLQSSLLATKLGNDTKILQCLISNVNIDCNDNNHDSEVSEAGIKAILSLITTPWYRENLVKEGLVGSLMTYIVEIVERKDKEVGSKATKALELVLEMEKGREEFMVNEVLAKDVIRALIKMVFIVSGDDEGSESAVNCVMILCEESLEMSEEAICGGILTQLLLLLQSQCSGRAKTRARMLLKLLRSMWAKDQKHVL